MTSSGYAHRREGSGALRGRKGGEKGGLQGCTSISSDSSFEFDLTFDAAALGSSCAETVRLGRTLAEGPVPAVGVPRRGDPRAWRRPTKTRVSDGEVQRRNGGRVSRWKEEGTCVHAHPSEATLALVTGEDERRRIWKDRDTPVAQTDTCVASGYTDQRKRGAKKGAEVWNEKASDHSRSEGPRTLVVAALVPGVPAPF
ncbi:hypothetical protein B0H17DRAFT_1185585 [Mycena rosella]|uniref:Uncharacterized protein n=1 Tax=Mycena rosella TaxID=1033263 RepID=A0AAD7CR09_MYCRO|nr:hypothetical protein B0H17DRAFT_1185585 [Mycena rosella]